MRPRLVLLGNPNSGKTTFFNALSGARERVSNYPGVTVERHVRPLSLGSHEYELVDVPGLYSLAARSPEEEVALHESLVREPSPAAVIVVVDSTVLGRGLYLALQVRDLGLPLVVALSMTDELAERGLTIDQEALAQELGCPVIRTRGRQTRDGLEAALRRPGKSEGRSLSPELETQLARISSDLGWAELALLSWDPQADAPLRHFPEGVLERTEQLLDDSEADDPAETLIATRYAEVDRIAAVVEARRGESQAAGRLETWLQRPSVAFASLALVLLALFQLLYVASEPLIGGVEYGIAALQGGVRSLMPESLFRSLLVDGVVAGVGNVLVFVPQIGLLFLLLGLLEDSGYLARIAFLLDRPLSRFGLQGKAVVPMLSGFACAIPAILSTRTLSSFRDRLLTMLAIPYLTCSARLPVFVLITAAVFPAEARFAGIQVAAVALLAMYAVSVAAALLAAWSFSRILGGKGQSPLVLELPPLRLPQLRSQLAQTLTRVRAFVREAGTVILAFTVVIWALFSFPQAPETHDAQQALQHSAGGRLGHVIEPALEPLGLDWRMGVGILSAFAAREVFVSTLGVVFGLGSEVDEGSPSLRQSLRRATKPDGSPLLTTASALALMVFFALACQCMSTVAVVKRESGGWRWPLIMLGSMSAVAYLAAWLTHWLTQWVTRLALTG